MQPNLDNWLLKAFAFVCTSLLSITLFIAKDIREDVKLLTSKVPAIEQQIKQLENGQQELRHKIFVINVTSQPAKHEPFITLASLTKNN